MSVILILSSRGRLNDQRHITGAFNGQHATFYAYLTRTVFGRQLCSQQYLNQGGRYTLPKWSYEQFKSIIETDMYRKTVCHPSIVGDWGYGSLVNIKVLVSG